MKTCKSKAIIIAAMVLSIGLPATLVISPVCAKPHELQLNSKGMVTFDEDGDGKEDVALDSQDLKNIRDSVETAESSQAVYARELETLGNQLQSCLNAVDRTNSEIADNKKALVDALHEKFPKSEQITALNYKSSFEDIKEALNSLSYTDSQNYILTKNNKEITLPAGYYEGVTVSTDIPTNGKVTYMYHHHTNGKDDKTDTNEKHDDLYGDDYIAKEKGGCFTKPVYKIRKTVTQSCPGVGREPVFGGHAGEGLERNGCPVCGYSWTDPFGSDNMTPGHGRATTVVETTSNPTGSYTIIETGYACNCGRRANEMVSATIEY